MISVPHLVLLTLRTLTRSRAARSNSKSWCAWRIPNSLAFLGFRQLVTMGAMVRRDDVGARAHASRRSSPAGTSPASVSAGAPSSRPQTCGESRAGQAGCQEPVLRQNSGGSRFLWLTKIPGMFRAALATQWFRCRPVWLALSSSRPDRSGNRLAVGGGSPPAAPRLGQPDRRF
jgi:hypothetical protein